MPASPFDSAHYRDVFLCRETATLFSDTAELRAMLLVWGALAQAQAREGLVPETAARAIQRAAMEVQIDPAALNAETGQNGVVVPALVGAFRAEMKAPEHAAWLHFGATSQDIIDTGRALRLRQFLTLVDKRLAEVLSALAALAQDHAETPMAGRTFGQAATPITFGAQAASWGAPLLRLRAELPHLRGAVLQVSLSGAAGTLAAMGPKGPAVRAGLAQGLGLADPQATWHAERDGIAALAAWATRICTALARIGEDMITLTSTDLGELRLPGGASSTMPQKQNPVAPSVVAALGRHALGLNQTLQAAVLHRQQRDAVAWMSEWLALPQLCMCLGRSLALGAETLRHVQVVPKRMAANLDEDRGLLFAEALSFHLSTLMPRPEAQAATKQLCAEADQTGVPLPALASRDWPQEDFSAVFDAAAQLGNAPAEARTFAASAAEACA